MKLFLALLSLGLALGLPVGEHKTSLQMDKTHAKRHRFFVKKQSDDNDDPMDDPCKDECDDTSCDKCEVDCMKDVDKMIYDHMCTGGPVPALGMVSQVCNDCIKDNE